MRLLWGITLLLGGLVLGVFLDPPPALSSSPVQVPIGPPVDQTSWPACVGFALHNFLAGGQGPHTNLPGLTLYRQAKRYDDHPTEDGTWMWAAVEAAVDDHLLQGATFSSNIEDGLAYLRTGEGFLVSSALWSGMTHPDAQGVVTDTGVLVGYHAYFCFGYDPQRGLVSCQNSWGGDWGDHGTFRMQLATLAHVVMWQGIALPVKERRPIRWITLLRS